MSLRLKGVVSEVRTSKQGTTVVLTLTAAAVAIARHPDGTKLPTLRLQAGSATNSCLELEIDTPEALALFALNSEHFVDLAPTVPVGASAEDVEKAAKDQAKADKKADEKADRKADHKK